MAAMNITIRSMTLAALMIALMTLATLIIRIPNPATQGYINLGDAMLMTIALLFGWRIGGLAGGVGSALADALGGYFIWAPWAVSSNSPFWRRRAARPHSASHSMNRVTGISDSVSPVSSWYAVAASCSNSIQGVCR